MPIVLLVAIACMCSCARRVSQRDMSSVVVSDSVHRVETHSDSMHAEKCDCVAVVTLDSIIIYDSVHVIEHADGTRDTYRYRDRYRSAKHDVSKAHMQSTIERTNEVAYDTIKSMAASVEKSEKTTTKRMTALSRIMLTAIVSSLILIFVLSHLHKAKGSL